VAHFLSDYRELVAAPAGPSYSLTQRFISEGWEALTRARRLERRTAKGIYFLKAFGLNEVGHSATLEFFLSRHASHSQGSLFFEMLTAAVNSRTGRTLIPEDYARSKYATRREPCLSVGAERPRTDIEIRGRTAADVDFVIHIENKVTAKPHENQLNKEWQGIVNGCRVGQHPYGFLLSPSRPRWLGRTAFKWIGWRDVVHALREFAERAAPRASFAAEQYAQFITRNIVSARNDV
jgi:hypothetical protein